jgi:hypothetical protein
MEVGANPTRPRHCERMMDAGAWLPSVHSAATMPLDLLSGMAATEPRARRRGLSLPIVALRGKGVGEP